MVFSALQNGVLRGAIFLWSLPLLKNRCAVLESVVVTCEGVPLCSQSRCRVSTRAKRPGGRGSRPLRTTRSSPDPIHDPAPSSFLGLKANPAFGRPNISRCSGAVHGSRPVAATIFNSHAAGLGDWLPRSPRSGLAAHAVMRSLVAFYAPTLNKTVARLRGCGDSEAGGRASG